MSKQKTAEANLETLYRIFTVPEAPDSTLGKIDQSITEDLAGFLQASIVVSDRKLVDIEKDFSSSMIPEQPTFVSEQISFLMEKLVAQSVHVASPSFVGHMTSALPYFMLPLARIMLALNQNLVKVETSKAFTPMERQVIGMIHRLVYEQDDAFYTRWMHDRNHAIGSFCSGGTIANLTALWAARNNALPADAAFAGITRDGMAAGLAHYGYRGLAILVSERGHYSLAKAADILGIGRNSLIAVTTDARNKVDITEMRRHCQRLEKENYKIMALVGVCGSSETGSIDPLDALADLAEEKKYHLHVDSAWGGPTLFSRKYRHLLKGLERASSVTLDAHKQMYVPLGAGLCVFRIPETLASVEHHAEYIIRRGSKDIGSHSVEGSRPGMALLVHSGLNIIGKRGYELLIDEGIEKAKAFAQRISAAPDFELISAPELNILTYRYVPEIAWPLLNSDHGPLLKETNALLNDINKSIQKIQRNRGISFVSRTQLNPVAYHREVILVLRVVLANPLTTLEILQGILDEQRDIAKQDSMQDLMASLNKLAASVNQG